MGLFGFLKKTNDGKNDNKKPEVTERATNNADSPQILPVDLQPKQSEIRIERAPEPNIMSIEERINGTATSCDGLYPHEVLVLSYAKRFHSTDDSFQGFWWYHYGIKDVHQVLDSLEKRGYIQIGTVIDAVMDETIPTIKEELKKRDLKLTGKKVKWLNESLKRFQKMNCP